MIVTRSPALLGLLGWFKYYGVPRRELDNLFHALARGGSCP